MSNPAFRKAHSPNDRPYSRSMHLAPQRHPHPNVASIPCLAHRETPPQTSLTPIVHYDMWNQTQVPGTMPTSVPSTAMQFAQVHTQRRPSEPTSNSANASCQAQQHPRTDVRQTDPDGAIPGGVVRPGHIIPNTGDVYRGTQFVPPQFLAQEPAGKALHLLGHASTVRRSPQVSDFPPLIATDHSYVYPGRSSLPTPPSEQQQTQANSASANTGEPASHRHSHQALNKSAVQAAERHAASILAGTYSSLQFLYEAQKSTLRDELLHLSEQHKGTMMEGQEARRRAFQIEREAKEKHEAALRASESIVSRAMEWKESLEDTRRKYAVLQEQNAKLAQIALRLNNVVATDPSKERIATLSDRVAYLEAKLRKCEDATSPIEKNLRIPESESDCGVNSCRSSLRETPISPEKDATGTNSSNPDANQRRRQKIVAKLLEGRFKAGALSGTNAMKEEPLTMEGEGGLLNVPYVINLTIEGRDRQHHSRNQSMPVEPEPPIAPDSDVLSPPTESAASSTEPESAGILPLGDPPVAGDNQASPTCALTFKRAFGSDIGAGQLRKRVRLSDPSSSRLPEESKNVPQVQEDEGNSATSALGIDFLDKSGRSSNTREDNFVDEAAPSGQERGTELSSEEHPPMQLDPVHLQLIYHKLGSGSRECRLCLMETGDGMLNEATIFPTTVQNEELIAHAISIHHPTVCYMLGMERAEILTAFARIIDPHMD